MASPRARMAGKGDCENGWKRVSSVRSGVASLAFPCAAEAFDLFLNQLKNVRVLV